jgi:Rab GDP dissociation inhibitor
MVSSAHNVCPKGYYVAIVSTIAETDANHHLELEPGFERLGEVEERFFGPPTPLYEPVESGEKDNVYISRSYDATSHFETTTGKSVASDIEFVLTGLADVRDLYRRATGEELVVEGLREDQKLAEE